MRKAQVSGEDRIDGWTSNRHLCGIHPKRYRSDLLDDQNNVMEALAGHNPEFKQRI